MSRVCTVDPPLASWLLPSTGSVSGPLHVPPLVLDVPGSFSVTKVSAQWSPLSEAFPDPLASLSCDSYSVHIGTSAHWSLCLPPQRELPAGWTWSAPCVLVCASIQPEKTSLTLGSVLGCSGRNRANWGCSVGQVASGGKPGCSHMAPSRVSQPECVLSLGQ